MNDKAPRPRRIWKRVLLYLGGFLMVAVAIGSQVTLLIQYGQSGDAILFGWRYGQYMLRSTALVGWGMFDLALLVAFLFMMKRRRRRR